MSMDELKQRVGKLKKKLDANGDGVVSDKELLSPTAIKLLLVTLASLIFPELMNSVVMSITNGSIVWNGLYDVGQIVLLPFIMIYFFKSLIDDYDKKLASTEDELLKAKEQIRALEAEHKLDIQKENNRYEMLEQQMKYLEMVKNNEIERLKNG